jgi:hypothetical protein
MGLGRNRHGMDAIVADNARHLTQEGQVDRDWSVARLRCRNTGVTAMITAQN